MAAASSAAILNGLGSYFLSGGKRSQTLLSAPIGGASVPAAPRRLVITLAVAPKKSWILSIKSGGNLIDPEWLDGSFRLRSNAETDDQRVKEKLTASFRESITGLGSIFQWQRG
ncbi:hypothetical protein L2E82_45186 [Cichorium intybus]|uniref:Uncharacterized protein n=1 Tax=Cichorium intybus TaxID=13427 RepID=A0ACB8ZSI9_CICIN|nr:hypothetical protein L2E82_45186 [Cichorium intybus]